MIQIGQVLNDTYEVLERIGSGGGGIIFKAYHRRMRMNVAIKLIKEDVANDLRNRDEVDILKKIKNDYLPQVLDFVEDGRDVYTVMEFIEGQNFKQIIQGGRQFSEAQVRRYAVQLCDAVEYLHNHVPPIIHSDIKPANIMLTPQDNICLIDFNISMVANSGTAVSKGGSKDFGAPEQFKRVIAVPVEIDEFHEETRFMDSDETEILSDDDNSVPTGGGSSLKTKNASRAFIDTRTDIYGIGASVYYMLTSRVPAGGRLDFRGIHCSSAMQEAIEKAMDPVPSKRFRNAEELRRALAVKVSVKPAVKAAAVFLGVSCIGIAGYMLNTLGVFGGSSFDASEELNDEYTASVHETTAVISETEKMSTETTAEVTTVPIETETSGETISFSADNLITVPDVAGLAMNEAGSLCDSAGLLYKFINRESDTVKKGYIISQSIPAGTKVEDGAVLNIFLSTGKAANDTSLSSAETTVETTTAAPPTETTVKKTTAAPPAETAVTTTETTPTTVKIAETYVTNRSYTGDNMTIIYTGEWKDGMPHGKGEGTFTDSSGAAGIIKGQWNAGHITGTARLNYDDGRGYEGELLNGLPNGQGTMLWDNGDMYKGGWKSGKIEGYGTCTWSFGSKYEGDWKNNQMNGTGEMVYSDGCRYYGEWKNGKRDGKGKFWDENGELTSDINWKNDEPVD